MVSFEKNLKGVRGKKKERSKSCAQSRELQKQLFKVARLYVCNPINEYTIPGVLPRIMRQFGGGDFRL